MKPTSVINQLRTMMRTRKITVHAAALKLGVSSSALSRMMHGDMNVLAGARMDRFLTDTTNWIDSIVVAESSLYHAIIEQVEKYPAMIARQVLQQMARQL